MNSNMKRSISVVFPALNEEMNIEKTLSRALEVLPTFTDAWELIVVDDGSVDKTAEKVEKFRESHDNIRLIRHGMNLGYGAALKSGIIAAKKDLIFFSDSDLQFDIAELGKLLEWIDSYDIVVGYRANRQDPLYRKINAFGWNMLVRLLLGLKVRDVGCAFKLFRRSVFDGIAIDARGAMVNADILVQALRNGSSIKEVPVMHYPRLHGEQTGAKTKVIFKAFVELILLHNKLKMGRKPRRNVRLKYKFIGRDNEFSEDLVNISEGGVRLKTNGSYRPNEIVDLAMISDSGEEISITSRVLRVKTAGEGYEVALEFVGSDKKAIRTLKGMTARQF